MVGWGRRGGRLRLRLLGVGLVLCSAVCYSCVCVSLPLSVSVCLSVTSFFVETCFLLLFDTQSVLVYYTRTGVTRCMSIVCTSCLYGHTRIIT